VEAHESEHQNQIWATERSAAEGRKGGQDVTRGAGEVLRVSREDVDRDPDVRGLVDGLIVAPGQRSFRDAIDHSTADL
jgi:hypothetical protein